MTHCEPIAVNFKSPNKAALQNKVLGFIRKSFSLFTRPSEVTITFPPLSHLTFVPVQSQPATKLLSATHLQAVSRNGAVQASSQRLKYTTTCQNSSFTNSCASPLRCLHQVMTSSSSSFLFDFLVALMTSGVRGQKD